MISGEDIGLATFDFNSPTPTHGQMHSTLNALSIFDGVQSESEMFSTFRHHLLSLLLCDFALKKSSHSISIFAHAKRGLPISLGSVRIHASHFSDSIASPVMRRSGSPQMRIARCLYGSDLTHTSYSEPSGLSSASCFISRWLCQSMIGKSFTTEYMSSKSLITHSTSLNP